VKREIVNKPDRQKHILKLMESDVNQTTIKSLSANIHVFNKTEQYDKFTHYSDIDTKEEWYVINGKKYISIQNYSNQYTTCFITFLKLTVEEMCDIEEDWNYYSKAYHRSHGPKVITSNRRLVFKDLKGNVVKIVNINAFAGKYLHRTIHENFNQNNFLKRDYRMYLNKIDYERLITIIKRKRKNIKNHLNS
jgi:hypothetical protein